MKGAHSEDKREIGKDAGLRNATRIRSRDGARRAGQACTVHEGSLERVLFNSTEKGRSLPREGQHTGVEP